MKINKQYILLSFIIIFAFIAYSFIPNFEREQFNSDVIEDISSGTITTTTLIPDKENNLDKRLDNVLMHHNAIRKGLGKKIYEKNELKKKLLKIK